MYGAAVATAIVIHCYSPHSASTNTTDIKTAMAAIPYRQARSSEVHAREQLEQRVRAALDTT